MQIVINLKQGVGKLSILREINLTLPISCQPVILEQNNVGLF